MKEIKGTQFKYTHESTVKWLLKVNKAIPWGKSSLFNDSGKTNAFPITLHADPLTIPHCIFYKIRPLSLSNIYH